MKQQFGVNKIMETTITVGAYTYHLVEYAYVTASQRDLVGYSKSPDIKFAGEIIKEIGDDCEWLTVSTPIERAPLGDTFVMEGIEGEANLTRHELLQQLEEEKWLSSHRVKPGWQPFS
jgi:hypothetical protein